MKEYILVAVAMVLFVSFASWMVNHNNNPCAIANNTPMGTVTETGPANHNLSWDQSCASGMRWMR